MRPQSSEFITAASALRNRTPGAETAMERLAKDGDPDAMMMVGEFRLIGAHGARNLAKGYKLVAAAAEKGQPNALRAHIYLTAAGIGRKANPKLARNMLKRLAKEDRFAAVQDGLIDYLQCQDRVRDIEPEVISKDPYIVRWNGLFNEAEYGYLRHVASPHLAQAMIVDDKTGAGVLDPVRDSFTSSIPMIEEDLIVQAVNRTIAIATDTPVENGEQLSILRYTPGQQYHPHYDAYPDAYPAPQRSRTALIWLNDDYTGGETGFPRIGIKVKGKAGDMLVFDNLDQTGSRDDRMEHAGLPVESGEKWMASRWITQTNLLELGTYG